MSTQANPLLATLLKAGLVYAEPPTTENLESPWYVKVLLAFSGWLAAIFLLFFIGSAFRELVDSKTGLGITGLFMIGAAVATLFRIRDNDFLEHLMLAFSMAGHAMLWAALFSSGRDAVFDYWLIALFEALLAVFVPNVLHRIFSSSAAVLALLAAMLQNHPSGNMLFAITTLYADSILFFTAFLWLNEFRHPQHIRKIQAIAYGCLLILIPLNIFISASNKLPSLSWIVWLNAALATAIMFFVGRQLVLRTDHTAPENLQMAIVFIASLSVGILSAWMPGITIGLVLIALGFSASNRVLLGLGFVSLLGFISNYYYALHATLLHKSMTLAIAGSTLLLARWLMLHMLRSPQDIHHGQ